MTRRTSTTVFVLVLASSGILSLAVASPSTVSSRMRSHAGRMETSVRADAESVALDTIAVHAIRLGYALVSSDKKHLRLRLEEPATQAEISLLGRNFEGTERKRLEFEVVRGRQPGGRLRIIGALILVTNPGTTSEVDEDMGKRQPFRNELKALIQDIRAALGP